MASFDNVLYIIGKRTLVINENASMEMITLQGIQRTRESSPQL